MRVLLDTNIILDYLLKRNEFFETAKQVWDASLDDLIQCTATASSLTDIFYIVRRQANYLAAKQAVKVCLTDLEILTVDRARLLDAYANSGHDFEDNLQIACADHNNIDFILTRDVSGFVLSPIEAMGTAEFVQNILGYGEQEND